jgi:chitodextrinase
VGLTKLQAIARLEQSNLKPAVKEQPVSGAVAGTVVSQTPAAGVTVKAGATITIVVASGSSSNQPPVPRIDGPSSVKAGEKITFDASASTDDGQIATYYWEFGDGATGQGRTTSHTWSTPGKYEVTLWVTDDQGVQASVTKSVNVRLGDPTVEVP